MKILLSNDDGYFAAGLAAFALAPEPTAAFDFACFFAAGLALERAAVFFFAGLRFTAVFLLADAFEREVVPALRAAVLRFVDAAGLLSGTLANDFINFGRLA